jgi:phosphatidylglycerophosphate synthase
MNIEKILADSLTAARLPIAVLLVVVGLTLGKGGWHFAALLVLVSWTSDIVDGALARLSRTKISTWIGSHDLYFDMAVAVGVLTYLTAAGSINTSISILYILSWIIVFTRFGILSALGKLFQAPIYTWFIIAAFQSDSSLGALFLIYLLVIIVLTWPRFPKETIPDFLTGFGRGKQAH